MRSRKRLLQAFARVADPNLRALISDLVNVYREHEDGKSTPLAHYKSKVDAYAGTYGDELDPLFHESVSQVGGGGALDGSSHVTDAAGSSGHQPVITLESLKLVNFGSYCGENNVELAPNGTRNVTAVVGSNGDGKSTLFFALNWALYGDDYLSDLHSSKRRGLDDLVNRAAVQAAAETGRPIECSVTLWFSIEGSQYYVTREAAASANRVGAEVSVNVSKQPTKLRKVDASGNHSELFAGALLSLLSQLPSNVRDFYLFDGEDINRFVSPGSQVHIRHAIRRVMGIEALENTARDITKVSAFFRSEAKKRSTGELAEVREKIEVKKSLLAEERRKVDEGQNAVLSLKSRVSGLDDLLARTRDTRPLQERRLELQRHVREFSEDEERVIYELRDLACHASLLFAGRAVERLVSDLDRERQAGIIPGPISRQLLSDLMQLGTCICGNDVSEGTKSRAILESRLRELAEQTEASEFQLELFYGLGSASQRVRDRAEILDKRRVDLARIRERLQDARQELKAISEKLENIDIVDRSGWERERRDTHNQLVAKEAAILNGRSKIDDLNAEIGSLENRERQLADKQDEAAAAVQRARWSEAAESNLRRIFEVFAAQARADVERETSRLWRAMLGNITNYRVAVTDDFELQVYDELGKSAMHELAMGQQQCLGLAFITAVAQVAEARPPLVIDMPFGRLGADVAQTVAATLPTLSSQLLLFVLPGTEWNSHTRRAIDPFLAREYRIRFDSESQCTQFIPLDAGVA